MEDGSSLQTTARNKRTWTMSYLPLSSSGICLCMSSVWSDRLAGSHSLGGYWSAEMSNPSRWAEGNRRLTSISQILAYRRFRYTSWRDIRIIIPCTSAHVSDAKIVAILYWNGWVDIVTNNILPKVMLEIQPFSTLGFWTSSHQIWRTLRMMRKTFQVHSHPARTLTLEAKPSSISI